MQQMAKNMGSIKVSSFVLAAYISLAIALGFLIGSPEKFMHWFVVPVLSCGILIGAYALDLLRGKLDIFDPAGIIGLLGFHFFFMAPLLHVNWDYWMRYVVPPEDWRPWLGWMATVNLAGLLLYHLMLNIKISPSNKLPRMWQVNEKLFPIILAFALVITALAQLAVYRQYGGIQGYIQTYEAGANAFVGMGWVFMISESFPILAFMGYAFWARKHPKAYSWRILIIVLVLFLVLTLFFGGLRGSRSNTVWKLFWAVGIIHFWVRPVPKQIIYSGIVFLITFMYIYGFYKGVGSDVIKLVDDFSVRFELETETGRTIETILLGDLGRSDVQAFLLYRLTRPYSDYEYAWGRTYVGAAALLIPRSLWPDRPETKVKAGTQVQYGIAVFPTIRSSRIYALAGETMLNFGVTVVPIAFAVFGLLVRKLRLWFSSWAANDARWLFAPFLVNMCFLLLTADSDNLVFVLVKNGTVPFIVVYLSVKITTYGPNRHT